MPQTLRILVADKLADEAVARLTNSLGVDVITQLGLDEAALASAIQDVDALLIRSSVKVTARVLENPGRLRAIARAGVGVDNVDLDAATAKGILVMNTPDANTISTAEHTVAMLMAMCRNIPAADRLVRDGKFAEGRKSCVGVQLAGKTLGVIGLGRIGKAVAQRALGLDMSVIGFDPFFSGDSMLEGRVRVVRRVDEMLPLVDFLTVHTPLTEQTQHLISDPQIRLMKCSARVVNVARGGLYNEKDLADALNSNRLAGAAVDVFEEEPPPPDDPLLNARNVIFTPHLGASTREAQLAVSVEAVDAVLDYLLKDEIRGAVNVTGMPSLSDRDKRFVDLTRRLAMVAAPLLPGRLKRVQVQVFGSSLAKLGNTLARYAAVELLKTGLSTPPNLINVDQIAKHYEIAVQHVTEHAGDESAERVIVRVETDNGQVTTEGAVYFGIDWLPHLKEVSGYRMDVVPEGSILMIFNNDQPGVVGLIGTILGRNKVNIADMTLSRLGDKAMMLLKVDGAVPDAVMKELEAQPPVRHVHQVELPKAARTQ